ncbi:hypothetical protein TNCV_4990661 [Trichonephila clavipes]|nr:hypothetical protein TNCV_4990661 [Trichonephila clavipes]
MTQFLTGHGNFKSYLNKFSLVPLYSLNCDIGEKKNVEHVLLLCSKFEKERRLDFKGLKVSEHVENDPIRSRQIKFEKPEAHLKLVPYETPVVTVEDLTSRVVPSADIAGTPDLFERIEQPFVRQNRLCYTPKWQQLRTITCRCISEVELCCIVRII